MDCAPYPVSPRKVVAIARDKYLTPTVSFPDPANLSMVSPPKFGQDITTSRGRPAPHNQSVGRTPAELTPKMEKLLSIFASGDKGGMARRLFNEFLGGKKKVEFFEDPTLNQAAAAHGHIQAFCAAAMGIPAAPHAIWGRGGGRMPAPARRIHQTLKEAGWDISKLVAPGDLGVPAFNDGDKYFSTGDFNNGLGLMVNGVQYAYVLATHYLYDAKAGRYCIKLKYLFYDVFGLDDDDLEEFGSPSTTAMPQKVGITAWWQLQHQHGFAPLVTRIVVERSFEAPAS